MAPTVLMACLDLPSIEYETERALIGTDFDLELCRDDLDRVDRHIAFVEATLDAHSDEKLEIYIYESNPSRCPGAEGGSCYDRRRKMIRTHWFNLEHEVVHAIVDRFAMPTTFWSEGIAVALDGNGTFSGQATVMQSVNVRSPFDLDYATAGHFVRWLLEEHDPALIRPILGGALFEPVYDMPFAEAAARYEDERPHAYPPWFTCDYPPLPREADGWRESLEISCDTEAGSTTDGGPYSVRRTVELLPGRYQIETRGGFGTRLLGCQTDVFVDPPPDPPAMFHGDVPNQVESSQTHPGVLFESEMIHHFEITQPGLFKVVMMSRDEAETVEVDLRPVGE